MSNPTEIILVARATSTDRADGHIMTDRAARGSLAGRWAPRSDRRPNLVGALTIEQALPAGARL
jgi:hypothetical protein